MSRRVRTTLPLLFLGAIGWLAAAAWLAGCAANDPFDPESLDNHLPVVRFSVEPPEGGEFNRTSYNRRTFFWSGTDEDGWVTEYHVSIRTDGNNPAPWDTTTATDTTMSFVLDAITGQADATILLACRDNRGDMSDTLIVPVPMQNFPPVVGFPLDFQADRNLQRELIYDGAAVVDTVYWNWGPNALRVVAYDPDGIETMDDFYRYTLVDGGDPEMTWDYDDPAADPELGWVRTPLEHGDLRSEFTIFLKSVAPGDRTITVSVGDEAGGDQHFRYTWEVREPRSPVIYINSNGMGSDLYIEMMDEMFGAGQWDRYEFLYGFPDHAFLLLESLRKYEVVVWVDEGSTTAEVLVTATDRNGALEQYLYPLEGDDAAPGRLLLVTPNAAAASNSGPNSYFINNILKINPFQSSPQPQISFFAGYQAHGDGGGSYLPSFTGIDDFGVGRGLDARDQGEDLYRMEYNRVPGYQVGGGRQRPPFDPVIAVRSPARTTETLARTVTFSVQLRFFDHEEVKAALREVLITEMGVTVP